MADQIAEFLEVCERAARGAGQVLLDWQGRIRAREKGPKDLVTEADVEAQQTIQQILLGTYPDHGFLGEEEGEAADAERGDYQYRWIVDPLDGTANYVHGLQNYAVSIALERSGELLVGVVYDPTSDECFAAASGRGATLNGERLATSDIEQLDEALVAASFAPAVARDSREVARFLDMLAACQSLRRLGSAALNLCFVAAGRLDGYWASSVKTWDVAAGALILRESGGVITAMDGSPLDLERPELVAAANSNLHKRMLGTLNLA